MKIIKLFLSLFGYKGKPKIKKPQRRYLEDVKAGEMVVIEWSRIDGEIGTLLCLNNDPETKTILLQVWWNNYEEFGCKEKEKLVLSYHDIKLVNFHLLNSKPENKKDEHSKGDTDTDDTDDNDIATMQKKLNEALDKEEYEKADVLQKRINNLLNKK